MSIGRTLDLSWDPGPHPTLLSVAQLWFLLSSASTSMTRGQATQHQPLLPSGFGQNWVAPSWEPLLLASSQDSLLSQDVAVNPPKDFFVCCPLVLCPCTTLSLSLGMKSPLFTGLQASGRVQGPPGRLKLAYHCFAFLRSSSQP